MTTNDILTSITDWTNWASNPQNKRYDIALLKIWIQFEKFISELFVLYATGNTSESGFKPNLKLQFQSEEQLNAFLKEGNKTYIEFPTQIKKLSKHIFDNDPFDTAIFLDANNWNAYNEIIAIRNYIAHESGESKTKYIKTCFGNNEANYKEPNDLLQSKKKNSSNTYYTYYINSIIMILGGVAMAGRPRIYEEVDKEMKLEELVKTACDLFGPPYDDREIKEME